MRRKGALAAEAASPSPPLRRCQATPGGPAGLSLLAAKPGVGKVNTCGQGLCWPPVAASVAAVAAAKAAAATAAARRCGRAGASHGFEHPARQCWQHAGGSAGHAPAGPGSFSLRRWLRAGRRSGRPAGCLQSRRQPAECNCESSKATTARQEEQNPRPAWRRMQGWPQACKSPAARLQSQFEAEGSS